MIAYVARSSKLASRVIEGETIILSPKNSQLYSLNTMATVIWRAADGRSTLEEIVKNQICPDYDVDFDTAMNDASELIHDLAAQGLFVISDQPIQNVPDPYLERKKS